MQNWNQPPEQNTTPPVPAQTPPVNPVQPVNPYEPAYPTTPAESFPAAAPVINDVTASATEAPYPTTPAESFPTTAPVMNDVTVPATEAPYPTDPAESFPAAAPVINDVTVPAPIAPAENSYTYQPPEPPAPKKKNWGLRIFAIVLAGVILLGTVYSAGYLLGQDIGSDNGYTDEDTPSTEDDSLWQDQEENGGISSFDIQVEDKNRKTYTTQEIAQTVSKSIVNITVYSPDGSAGSYASGIIMDAKEGYVLTNDHIYSEIPGAKFLITLNDGTEFKATFVSGDSRSDIAILKIQNPKGLTAATFSTAALTVGESVLTIGQSYGYADTIAEGIVSAVDRRVSLSAGGYSEKFIQTTAAINPGNSGGALVNMSGQVVGVTSAKIASEEVEGLGFAIPTETALNVVKSLQENGKVVGRAKLGITYTELGTVQAEINELPVGLLIQEIGSGSDMAGKGISAGDVITKVNGEDITISAVLLDVIDKHKAGDTLELTVYLTETKQSKTVTVKLLEAESSNSYQQASSSNQSDRESDMAPFSEEDIFNFFNNDQNDW